MVGVATILSFGHESGARAYPGRVCAALLLWGTIMNNPLNSAAGAIPFPDDPREIQAAVKAANVLWRAYPYFGFRWGERGRRFGHSDCAYFLTLVGYDQKTVDKQVFWTADVLSQRGMPSLLLEQQLPILKRFAGRAMGDPDRYACLDIAAGKLKARRHQILDASDHLHIARTFAGGTSFPEHRLMIGTGYLFASAAADEASGVKNAVSSLCEWFENPQHFDRRWIASVRDTVAVARGLVRIKTKAK